MNSMSQIQMLKSISKGFASYCHGRIQGCIMAIAGLVLRTRCPTKSEVLNQMAFRNRRGMFGLVVFAGCDHKCRFRMFSPKFAGATNDRLSNDSFVEKKTIIDCWQL